MALKVASKYKTVDKRRRKMVRDDTQLKKQLSPSGLLK
jgi:hypothetical protein